MTRLFNLLLDLVLACLLTLTVQDLKAISGLKAEDCSHRHDYIDCLLLFLLLMIEATPSTESCIQCRYHLIHLAFCPGAVGSRSDSERGACS